MNAPVRKIITAGLAGGLGLAALGIGASAAGVGRTAGSTQAVMAAPTLYSHHDDATPAPGLGQGSYAMAQGPANSKDSDNFAMMPAVQSSPAMRLAKIPVQGPMYVQGGSPVRGATGFVGMGGQMMGGR